MHFSQIDKYFKLLDFFFLWLQYNFRHLTALCHFLKKNIVIIKIYLGAM